jgi:hypothetical protein
VAGLETSPAWGEFKIQTRLGFGGFGWELNSLNSFLASCAVRVISFGWDSGKEILSGCVIVRSSWFYKIEIKSSIFDNLFIKLCGPEPCVLLSASIVRDINRRWIIDAHSKNWIALNSCRQSKLWIKNPKLQTTKFLKNSSEFWFLLSRGIVALINISTWWDWQQTMFVHLANWKSIRHFTFCVSDRLLQHWEHAFLASS